MLTISSITSEIKTRLDTPGIKAKPKTAATFRSLRNRLAQCKSLSAAENAVAKLVGDVTSPRGAFEVYATNLQTRIQKTLRIIHNA